MRHKIIYILSFLMFVASSVEILPGSTVGIATGSRTIDGRPLLFKNKDRTDNYPSDVNYYEGSASEHSYVYQQNDGQNHERARMGINTAGFGIVYTTSENLEGAPTGPTGSEFAAIALKSCATIPDFRALLDATNGVRAVHEHYAVIDSTGIGSLFEVDGYTYIEISVIDSIGVTANTSKYHPDAGPPSSGSTSPEREARAEYLLNHGRPVGLSYRYFVDEIIRDFSQTQEDEDNMPLGQYYTNPVLSRYKTAAGCVIHGIKSGDDPLVESVMWLCLSEPSLSVALPLFTNVNEIPSFIRSGAPGDGMAGSSDRIRQLLYDYSSGRYADRYIDSNLLMDIREMMSAIQDSLFSTYEENIEFWRLQSVEDAAYHMTNWTYDMHTWAKTNYDQIYSSLVIKSGTTINPTNFRLLQNYPNPYNNSTHIPFTLAESAQVKIEIRDILGQIIWQWYKNRLSPGHHEISFSTDDIPISAGIYFYTLKTNKLIFTRKMVYLP